MTGRVGEQVRIFPFRCSLGLKVEKMRPKTNPGPILEGSLAAGCDLWVGCIGCGECGIYAESRFKNVLQRDTETLGG